MGHSVSKLRILIADDHAIVRRGLRILLEAQPHWTVCAEAQDGHEAVTLAATHQPDVAILDFSLPNLNGLEATRQICAGGYGTRTLIYTMHQDNSVIRSALKAGASGYLLKSEPDSEIIRGVQAVAANKTYFSQRVGEYLLHAFLDSTDDDPSVVLTSRELQLVQLIAQGRSNKEVAAEWGVSVKTVETHRTSAMKKLNVRSAVELTLYAVRNRLIQP
jgi:DNA-binding NarL/FixJ family response regulator